ncbi:MAG: gamma-glutamyl-phosphate reductase, partial [Clostridia bacterium]
MENILKVISLVKNSINQIAYKTDFERNQMLDACCETLFENADKILQANLIDIENAKIASKPTSFIDRLQLTKTRIDGMIEGLSQLKAIESPIGNVQNEWDTKKEIHIKKVTVPLGVIGIIFEARPNVTADTIGLAIKSGNA